MLRSSRALRRPAVGRHTQLRLRYPSGVCHVRHLPTSFLFCNYRNIYFPSIHSGKTAHHVAWVLRTLWRTRKWPVQEVKIVSLIFWNWQTKERIRRRGLLWFEFATRICNSVACACLCLRKWEVERNEENIILFVCWNVKSLYFITFVCFKLITPRLHLNTSSLWGKDK